MLSSLFLTPSYRLVCEAASSLLSFPSIFCKAFPNLGAFLAPQCLRASRSLRRCESESSPARSAARWGWSARPAATLGPTSCGWRTIGRSWMSRAERPERKAGRRGGRWVSRTWRQNRAGSTRAMCSTGRGRSTPHTNWKSYVSYHADTDVQKCRCTQEDHDNDPHGCVIIERVCCWNNNTVNSACPAVRMTVFQT